MNGWGACIKQFYCGAMSSEPWQLEQKIFAELVMGACQKQADQLDYPSSYKRRIFDKFSNFVVLCST